MIMFATYRSAADGGLGAQFELIFRTVALQHARNKLQNNNGLIPWDVVCEVTSLYSMAKATGYHEIATSHREGLVAIVRQVGGLRNLSQHGVMGQFMASALAIQSLFESALTAPLYPILCDTSAGGDFMPGGDVFVPISPLYCHNGDFPSLLCSHYARPETVRLLTDTWLLFELVVPKSDAIPISTPVSVQAYLNLRTKLLNYPTYLSFAGPNPSPRDYVCESCRLSAIMMLNSLDQSLPLGVCEMNRPIVAQLEQCVRLSKPRTDWCTLEGALYNTLIIGAAASIATNWGCFRGFVTRCHVRYCLGAWITVSARVRG